MEVDKSKMGNVEYGMKTEKELKEMLVGLEIVDVRYNYFAECFDIILSNGIELTYEK
jgi:hypothetical protein